MGGDFLPSLTTAQGDNHEVDRLTSELENCQAELVNAESIINDLKSQVST